MHNTPGGKVLVFRGYSWFSQQQIVSPRPSGTGARRAQGGRAFSPLSLSYFVEFYEYWIQKKKLQTCHAREIRTKEVLITKKCFDLFHILYKKLKIKISMQKNWFDGREGGGGYHHWPCIHGPGNFPYFRSH